MRHLALLTVFGLLLLSVALAAQKGGQSRSPSTPIPLHHRYAYFLQFQIVLDKRADALDQAGEHEKATALRNHIQHDLQFSNEQMAIVRGAALKLQSDLKASLDEALPVINADRQWIRAHGRKSGPPPGAKQVHELQEKREDIIRRDVEGLNSQLGENAAAKLQTYVAARVQGQMTRAPQPLPGHNTPNGQWGVPR